MSRLPVLVLSLAAFCAGQASSLEVKNVRMVYGPYGATRTETKFLPGDFLLLMYDLEGLSVDAKTGKVRWDYTMDVLDNNGKSAIKQPEEYPAKEFNLQLGGNRAPADHVMQMPPGKMAGKYTLKLTFKDLVAKKNTVLLQPFELLKGDDFGMFGMIAPSYAVPGSLYTVRFFLANSPVRDKDGDKKKSEFKGLPAVETSMQVYEEGIKKALLAKPVLHTLPGQLPEMGDPKLIPVDLPLYVNRPGRFYAEVEVYEKLTEKKLKVKLPFTVLDLK